MTTTESVRINGWLIVAHGLFLDQVEAMIAAVIKDKARNPTTYKTRRAAKVLAAVACLAFKEIPEDPARDAYQQGNTLGEEYRHWRRAKFYQQYRLFFRYRGGADGKKVIAYGWVNDEDTKRAYDSKTDAYAVFRRMLDNGNPPDDWADLKAACDAVDETRLAKLVGDVKGLIDP
jgi:toxin YhaV